MENHFNRWLKSGVINIIFNRLLSLLDANGFVDWSVAAPDDKNAPPGSKKHPDIDGDNGPSRSRGGLDTKIHLAADGAASR